MNQRIFSLHFIGIGGIGMSGIAEIFLSRGHQVSGSDLGSNEITERLVRMGARIEQGHDASNLIHQNKEVDAVVVSSAVRADNPEVLEAKRLGIPVIPRAEMLAEIMRGKTGIAVAGTHGKTTTTSMCAQILIQSELDPTVVVGGKVEAIGSNAKSGSGTSVVVEADESDGSFHYLPATYQIITNVDLDHMEHYGTRENLNDAFILFAKKIPFYGCTWLCGDDEGVKQILPFLTKPHVTYGFEESNDVIARELTQISVQESSGQIIAKQRFELWIKLRKDVAHSLMGEVELGVLGRHNVLNSLAAASLAIGMGVPFHAVQTALSDFKHVRRRFDERYHSSETNIRLIDDYGHHPTEVRAVLSTAQQTGHSRIVTVFQPHRYTRTQLCWKEFLTCFKETDVLVMLPIYAASEDPIEGVSAEALCRELRAQAERDHASLQIVELNSLELAKDWVLKHQLPGDLILTLGAGSITKLADALAKSL